MRLAISSLACWGMLLGAVPNVHGGPNLQFVGFPDRPEAPLSKPAVFADQEQVFEIEIDGVTAQNAVLFATLFQISGTIAAPLQKDIRLKEGLKLSAISPETLRLSLKFPEVKRRTEILVQFSAAPSPSAAKPIALGEIRFEVFPASVTGDLADSFSNKSGPPKVVIFGRGQKLRTFCTGQKIPFEEGGSGIPDRFDPDRIYLGELSTEADSRKARDYGTSARLAVFAPDESLPPGIYSEHSNSGTLVQVNGSWLDHLKTDPRTQLSLLKIIRLLSLANTSPN